MPRRKKLLSFLRPSRLSKIIKSIPQRNRKVTMGMLHGYSIDEPGDESDML
jgi:hypothetical protein